MQQIQERINKLTTNTELLFDIENEPHAIQLPNRVEISTQQAYQQMQNLSIKKSRRNR